MSETRDFVEALLGYAPESLHTLLWTRSDKRSHWFAASDIDGISETAGKLAVDHDVYIATTLTDSVGGANQRWSADRTAAMVALWADIDFVVTEGHRKLNYPATQDAAIEVVDACGLAPSILVQSGHGLQAWWLLDEPLVFTDAAALAEGHDLIRTWQETLRARAIERGSTIDSTHDLTRVMRVPGTFNRKIEDEVKPVQTLRFDISLRYSSDDFSEHFLDADYLRKLEVRPEREYVVADITFNEKASPDFDKLQLILDVDERFRASWERKRKDMTDQSASSYDMSLASIASLANWSDQEIVNLLIAARRKHGDDLKRRDYYTRTVARARQTLGRDAAMESVDEVCDDLRAAKESGDPEEEKEHRRTALDSISEQVGIETLDVVRYLTDPGVYAIRTPIGEINLGETTDLQSWTKIRARLADTTRFFIPRFQPSSWDRLIQLIVTVAVEEDVGPEATEQGQVHLWLTEYLSTFPATNDATAAWESGYPYRDEAGDIFVFASKLRNHLFLGRPTAEKIRQREFALMLRRFGCESKTIVVSIGKGRTTRSAWRIPNASALLPIPNDDEEDES